MAAACGSWLLQSFEPEPDNLSRAALAVTKITLRTESAISRLALHRYRDYA
jgi:hypothetical protein